jgi:hypothetical protein
MTRRAAVHLALYGTKGIHAERTDAGIETHTDDLGVWNPAFPLIQATDALAQGIGRIDHQGKMAAIERTSGRILKPPQSFRRDGRITPQRGDGPEQSQRSKPSIGQASHRRWFRADPAILRHQKLRLTTRAGVGRVLS